MRGRAFGTVVCLLVATGAAEARPFKKGPYLQNVSQTSVTIMWESSRNAVGTVKLLDGTGREITETDPDEMHEVVLDNLEAGRRYRYQVDCEGETRVGEFATAPEASSPFSFVVFGDSRSNAGSHRRVVERVRREVPDFILGTGDMVDKGGRDAEWQTFFEVEGDLLRENVMFPSLGNHDRQGPGRTADNYRKYFSLPENSPNPERYYSFTYGNSRFLVLDSNAYAFALTDQTAWIEQQLQQARLDPSIEHIFVSMHHPPYSISLHGGRTELRNAWTPLYEKYGVTAVFSGHDHCYSRAEKNGIRYFVSGGGGAPLYPRSRKIDPIDLKANRYFERTNHYLRVVVVGELVEVTAVRADGSIMETVTWGKAPRPPEAFAGLRVGSPVTEPKAEDSSEESGVIREAKAPSEGGGFGALGMMGGLMAVLGGGALVWGLRR